MPFIHMETAKHKNSTQPTPAKTSTSLRSDFMTEFSAKQDISYNLSTFNEKEEEQCGHIFTTYILPSIMHLTAFILGFIYFRINENETLYAYVYYNIYKIILYLF